MGELSIQVRLFDSVVEDRVLRVREPLIVGDWPGARVGFPGAAVQVSRSGQHLRVLGRRLDEGESVEMDLGGVGVTFTHTEKLTTTSPLRPGFDHRFLGAALVMVMIGGWLDAAEQWAQRIPNMEGRDTQNWIREVVEAAQGEPLKQSAASARVARIEKASLENDLPAVAEGPRHRNDDALTGIGYHQWYRNMVPADQVTLEANRALDADPTDAEARRIVARAAYHAGRFELASWHYRTILKDFPHDTAVRLRLAWSLRRQGKHQAELDLYQAILDAEPQHLLALGGAATALARMARYGESQDTLDALQILAPTSPITEGASATIAAIRGNHEWAIASLRRAVESREQLGPEIRIEQRQDIAVDPAFATLRSDWRLRTMLRRVLGGAAPRGFTAKNSRTR